MSRFNIWVAASEEFAAETIALLRPGTDEEGNPIDPVEAVQFPLLNSVSEDTQGILTHDRGIVQPMFETVQGGERTYSLWSFYTEKGKNPYLTQAEFEALEDAYPADFFVLGMWIFDTGEQVEDSSVHPDLIHFMPDDVLFLPDSEDFEFERPTELSDVNLLSGQAPRDFN